MLTISCHYTLGNRNISCLVPNLNGLHIVCNGQYIESTIMSDTKIPNVNSTLSCETILHNIIGKVKCRHSNCLSEQTVKHCLQR